MQYKKLKLSIGLLLVVLFQTYAQERANTLSLSQQYINAFKEKAPLVLVDIKTTQLATRHYKGKGTPLVLIHGTLDDHHSLITLAALLAQKTTKPIILFDLRGHSSSVLTNQQPGSIVQDAQDVVKLIKKLGYKSAHIVGHSYGANIAIKLTNTHPAMVANLFLYEPPVFGLLINKPQYQQGVTKATQTIAQAKNSLEKGAIEDGVKLFIENIAFGAGSWHHIMDKRGRSAMTSNYLTFLDQLKDQQRFRLNIAQLNQHKGKIILLHGRQSLPLFKASIHEIRQVLNHEQLLLIEGAGHEGIFTQANQVASRIAKSLQ